MFEISDEFLKHVHGAFTLFPGTDQEIVVPNNIPSEGKLVLLKQALRADTSDVTAGGNYYLGLGTFAYADTLTLATLSGEMAVSHGYARQAVTRDVTGWPTSQQVSSAWILTSLIVTFAASGGSIGPFSRLFMCTVGSGSSGKLVSVSSALATPLTLTSGQSIPIQYSLYLN